MDNPGSLHEKLRNLAPMHLKKGVKKEQLPRFGVCLVNMLEGILKEGFTQEYRAAWEWLWTWLSQSLEQSLEEAVSIPVIVIMEEAVSIPVIVMEEALSIPVIVMEEAVSTPSIVNTLFAYWSAGVCMNFHVYIP